MVNTYDMYDDEYIPGTINVYADILDDENTALNLDTVTKLKTDGNIILHPQPSDSPNDPLNWSTKTKLWQLALLAFITGFTAATSNDAGSIQDSLNEIYGISYDSMNTGAGVLFIGIGYGTLVMAPSPSLWGRRLNYFICILLGLLGAVWFGMAKRTSDTIWNQLFVGISEACAEAQVQLSLSDMFFSHQLGSVLTVYIMATSVGTYLGPLIAGFIVEYATFRWVGWCSVIISGALLVVMYFTLFETYFDRSLYVGQINSATIDKSLSNIEHEHEPGHSSDEAKKIENTILTHGSSNEGGIDGESNTVFGTGSDEKATSYWTKIKMITPASNIVGWGFKQYAKRLFYMLRVFWFPPVILSGLMWGMQDAFLTFYLTTEDDDYYDDPWDYSDTGVAIMNVPCVIGAIVGCLYAGYFSDWFVQWLARKRGGVQEAEYRLYFIFVAMIISPAGMLMFGIGTDKESSWQVMYVGLGFIGFGWGCSGDIAMSYLMDAYPEMVLEGMVGVSVINNTIGCIFTFACSPWLDRMGNQNTYIILAVIDFVVMACCAPMIYWGKDCRRWTKKYYISFLELRDSQGN